MHVHCTSNYGLVLFLDFIFFFFFFSVECSRKIAGLFKPVPLNCTQIANILGSAIWYNRQLPETRIKLYEFETTKHTERRKNRKEKQQHWSTQNINDLHMNMSRVNSFSYSLIFNSDGGGADVFFRTSHSHLDSQSYTLLHKNLFSCSDCVSLVFFCCCCCCCSPLFCRVSL